MEKMHELLQTLADRHLTLGSAESITGGGFAQEATRFPGSSAVFKGGIVAYTPAIKESQLGVPSATIERYGLVSEAVAKAMATGGKNRLSVDMCVACTGNAGPGKEKGEAGVGDVYISVAYAGLTWTIGFRFGDIGREQVRRKAVSAMAELALSVLARPIEPAQEAENSQSEE